MTVYVDSLVKYTNLGTFRQGSCHLTVAHDGDLEELHTFAKRLGMQRRWFQDYEVFPHYDLTPARRIAAINAGAVSLGRHEFIRTCSRSTFGKRLRNVPETAKTS